MSPEELEGKIIIGEFVSKEKPEFTEELNRLIDEVAQYYGLGGEDAD
jgi:2-oxoglutarate ferredoxin oxidoreductase subunit beta